MLKWLCQTLRDLRDTYLVITPRVTGATVTLTGDRPSSPQTLAKVPSLGITMGWLVRPGKRLVTGQRARAKFFHLCQRTAFAASKCSTTASTARPAPKPGPWMHQRAVRPLRSLKKLVGVGAWPPVSLISSRPNAPPSKSQPLLTCQRTNSNP